MNLKARLEELRHQLKESHEHAPIMGMGEFIPACKREVAAIVGASLIKSTNPPPIPLEEVRLVMDNNDMKHPQALFAVPSRNSTKYLCRMNDDKTALCVETLHSGVDYWTTYVKEDDK